MSGGGAEREGDTESKAGSRLRAVSTEPDAGLEPTNREIMMSRSWTLNQLSHPGAPILMFIFERDRDMVGTGREREGDTESEVGSRLRGVSTEPDAGLELTDREIMTCAEVAGLTD